MTADILHGFDVHATRARLEAWCLTYYPWLGGQAGDIRTEQETVQRFLSAHWGEHAPPALMARCGFMVPAPRCTDSRCRLLGVALAVLEVDAHAYERKQRADIRWLEQAANRSCLSAIICDSLLSLARDLADAPVSRAVDSQTGGRPARVLANAVAQQLSCGGFSHRQIGYFMDAKIDAVRKRCAAADARSLGAYVHAPRVGPIALVPKGRPLRERADI